MISLCLKKWIGIFGYKLEICETKTTVLITEHAEVTWFGEEILNHDMSNFNLYIFLHVFTLSHVSGVFIDISTITKQEPSETLDYVY